MRYSSGGCTVIMGESSWRLNASAKEKVRSQDSNILIT